MHSLDSIVVVNRFFAAADRLKSDRVIRGLKTLSKRYGLNDWNLRTLRSNPERNIFQPAWLTYLVRDYGVNPEWLLMGTGEFYLYGVPERQRNRKKTATAEEDAKDQPFDKAGNQ